MNILRRLPVTRTVNYLYIYLVATLALALSFVLFALRVMERLPSEWVYAVLVFGSPVVFAALAAYLSDSLTVSMLLGGLPMWAVGAGTAFQETALGALPGRLVSTVVLMTWFVAMFAGAGFVIGAVVHHGRGLRDRLPWFFSRLLVTAVLFVLASLAQALGVISTGGQV